MSGQLPYVNSLRKPTNNYFTRHDSVLVAINGQSLGNLAKFLHTKSPSVSYDYSSQLYCWQFLQVLRVCSMKRSLDERSHEATKKIKFARCLKKLVSLRYRQVTVAGKATNFPSTDEPEKVKLRVCAKTDDQYDNLSSLSASCRNIFYLLHEIQLKTDCRT